MTFFISGDGDENVAFFGGIGHRENAKAVHYRFDALHRVNFCNDHVGTVAFGAHGHAASAPAVAGDDDFKAC